MAFIGSVGSEKSDLQADREFSMILLNFPAAPLAQKSNELFVASGHQGVNLA